jgi:hypothetical protein
VKIPGVKVILPWCSLFPESTRFFVEAIGAVFTAALATIPALEVIGFSKNNKALLREVVVCSMKSLLAALKGFFARIFHFTFTASREVKHDSLVNVQGDFCSTQ